MTPRPPIQTRSELLSRLTEACELEHGLACSYLFAAFSIKDQHDGSLTARQLVYARKWAGQLYLIAAQEMLHLAQIWNLLGAVGGTPYYLRPNFPQRAKYYPLNVPLVLEPFGESALLRFLAYERPSAPVHRPGWRADEVRDAGEQETIGELYDRIRAALQTLPREHLFLGRHAQQADEGIADFPDLIRVTDLASAMAALDLVTTQGEGVETDRENCHFGLFYSVLDELRAEQAKESFAPARAVVANPASRARGDYGADEPTIVTDPFTASVMDLFDDLYQLMLRALGHAFSFVDAPSTQRNLAQLAITLMPVVIKPLGEAITSLPAIAGSTRVTAGPAFAMSRHVVLPADAGSACVLVRERLDDLVAQARALAADHRANPRLQRCVTNLEQLAARSLP